MDGQRYILEASWVGTLVHVVPLARRAYDTQLHPLLKSALKLDMSVIEMLHGNALRLVGRYDVIFHELANRFPPGGGWDRTIHVRIVRSAT